MELGWGSGIKRILFGVFSKYYDEFQEIHNCRRYGDVEPLYRTHEFPRRQYCTDFTDTIVANICEEADSIYFLLDDIEFKTPFYFSPIDNKKACYLPATLIELHIVLSEQDYINKTTFFKGSHIIEPERVYDWWTNVQWVGVD